MILYVGEEANTLDTESWRMKPRVIGAGVIVRVKLFGPTHVSFHCDFRWDCTSGAGRVIINEP